MDRLGEAAVRVGLDLLAVDLHRRPRLAAAVDHEDTTVGFDVVEVKRRWIRVRLLAGGAAGGGGDAELPRLAPGALEAVGAEGGDPPLEGPLAAHPEGGPRLGAVLGVDDVVDEEVVAGDLERVAAGAGHRLPGEHQPLGRGEVDDLVVHRIDRIGAGGHRLRLGEQVAALHHLLERPDLALQAAVRRQLHAAPVGAEAPLAGPLVDGDDRPPTTP